MSQVSQPPTRMWLLTLLLMLTPIHTGHNLLRLRNIEIEENLPKQEYFKDNVYLHKGIDEADGKIPKFLLTKMGKKDKKGVIHMDEDVFRMVADLKGSKKKTGGHSEDVLMDLLGKIFLLLVEGPYKGLKTLTGIETKASKI